MTPNQTQGSGYQKYPTYVHCSPPSGKFSSILLYAQPFWDIPYFRFPLDSYVKIQKCHKIFKTWPIVKKSSSLYSTMVAQCPHKVWLTWDENCGRSSVLKFPPLYGPVLTKISKCHKFLFFARSPESNSLYQPLIMIPGMKIGWGNTVWLHRAERLR